MEARDLVLIVRFKEAGIIYCCYDLGFYTNLAIQVIKIINKMYYTLGGGGELLLIGISGWGCATSTLEPLAYTRASFSWILLPYNRVNSPNHSYPRVAVFHKLVSLAQSKANPKQSLIPES